MQEARDTDLLRQYVRENSEEAFAALVTRHVNTVYSAALRKTGNPAAAEEITQAVFVILAKKADQLSHHAVLSGWLYQAARLTAANFLRTEIRRTHREQEAYMQSLSDEKGSEIWPQIMPLLEDAMGRLGEKDRNALALRFFEGKSFQEIGAAFGASENAAKKRVAYALEKLRKIFKKRGVTSTAEAIAGAISANSIQTAPALLAKTATALALAKGATASTSTLTLIKGALKIMAWTKTKTAIITGVVALLVTGTTTLVIVKHQQQSHSAANGSPLIKGTNPGDFAPAKVSAMTHMKLIQMTIIPAFIQYAKDHDDEIPQSMADLQPYLPPDTGGIDYGNWEILASGKLTPQLSEKNIVLIQQKVVPSGQYMGRRIVGYTDGHFTVMKK